MTPQNNESLEYLKLDFGNCVKLGMCDKGEGDDPEGYEGAAEIAWQLKESIDALFDMFDNPEGIDVLHMKCVYYMAASALHKWIGKYVAGLNPWVLDDPNVMCEHEARLKELIGKMAADAAGRIGKSGDDEATANFIYVRDAWMVAHELGMIAE